MKTKLRKANKGDVAFITAHWANAARLFPQWYGIPNNILYHHLQKMMESVIPRSTVLILCVDDPEVPDDRSNIGFIVYEKTDVSLVVHFMYVKKLFQGQGFGKKLWSAVEAYENRNLVVYTSANKKMVKGPQYHKLQDKGWIYNPFILWSLDADYKTK